MSNNSNLTVTSREELFADGYRAYGLYFPPMPPQHLTAQEKEFFWDGVEQAQRDEAAL